MKSFFTKLAITLLVAAPSLQRSPPLQAHHRKCPSIPSGDFTVHQYQLYPENAIWDPEHCLVYFRSAPAASPSLTPLLLTNPFSTTSALFNGSISRYSPAHQAFLPSITFPNLTLTEGHHASGLDYTPRTNILSVIINSPNPFLTAGADVSGDNLLIAYDVSRQEEVWRANLTATTQGRWGGFVDVAVDGPTGDAYAVSSYPASVLRVGRGGKEVSVWYPPRGVTTVEGYTGCAAVRDVLLVAGMRTVWRFDLKQKWGTPVMLGRVEGRTSQVQVPAAYGGRVLLVSQELIGVTVFKSRDGQWRSAENLGTIRSDFPKELERLLLTTVQVDPRRQFMVGQYFPGDIVPGTMAGNRSDFPLFDITDEIDGLLRRQK